MSSAERRRSLRPPPYDFNNFLSKSRFDLIIKHLSYTSRMPPNFRDKFWRVREMIEEWNRNMSEVFRCSWVACLDESMSIWLNRWTCPGWIFVPRKPWPMGNEYHTMCCGISAIMFVIDLVEGKDRPPELPSLDPEKKGPTVSLLLRMCKCLYSTGTVIILDSGFCVVNGIVELMKKGVYAGAQIKKRRYWPKFVKGKTMVHDMKDDTIGTTRVVEGVCDRIRYFIFALKEPDYTSMIMSTYGCLAEEGPSTSRRNKDGTKTWFHYVQCFFNHFRYRHVVDDHNNIRMADPCIEKSLGTMFWENRVFHFILAISEVNTWLARRTFVLPKTNTAHKPQTFLAFRTTLASELIFNPWLPTVNDGEDDVSSETQGQKRKSNRISMQIEHEFCSAPPYASKFTSDGKWILDNKQKYQKKQCQGQGCKLKVRTYCSCCAGHWYCIQCWGNHRASAATRCFPTETN